MRGDYMCCRRALAVGGDPNTWHKRRMTEDAVDCDAREQALLANLRAQREELRLLLDRASNHWGYEDPVYRFYHQSFKVFGVQETTLAVVQRLHGLARCWRRSSTRDFFSTWPSDTPTSSRRPVRCRVDTRRSCIFISFVERQREGSGLRLKAKQERTSNARPTLRA